MGEEVVGQMWLGPAVDDQTLVGIITSDAPSYQRMTAVNRLTARIAACNSHTAAAEAARAICSAELVKALSQLLVEGEH